MESFPSTLKLNFIKDKLILAPMVRINTLPFRELVYAHGCDITFTEEIVAKKLVQCIRVVNEKINTIDYVTKTDNILVLRILPSEKNHLVLQLGASNPNDAVNAAKIVENDIIEKNAGGTYSYKGKKLCRGEEKFQKLLEEDDDLRRKLLRKAEINTIGTTRKKLEALGDVNYFPVDGVEYESQKDEEEDYEEE